MPAFRFLIGNSLAPLPKPMVAAARDPYFPSASQIHPFDSGSLGLGIQSKACDLLNILFRILVHIARAPWGLPEGDSFEVVLGEIAA